MLFDLDTDRDRDPRERIHAISSTADLCERLALYGGVASTDETPSLPMPDESATQGALVDVFDALVSSLTDTGLEDDLGDLLWATVNIFHRQVDIADRKLDANVMAQRASRRDQDGSEVRSVDLERLIATGEQLIERRDALERMRDQAADLYGVHVGRPWRPRTGSKVNRATLTAAIVDSRDFEAARRRADVLTLAPPGSRVAFTGGLDCEDHVQIWSALDRIRAKHPEMVLLHGASPRGAERIAACWADSRAVAQVVFRPDWARHGRAAPFKRNDRLLEAQPIGVVVFPGSGVSQNLADKARRLSIPVWRFTSA